MFFKVVCCRFVELGKGLNAKLKYFDYAAEAKLIAKIIYIIICLIFAKIIIRLIHVYKPVIHINIYIYKNNTNKRSNGRHLT